MSYDRLIYGKAGIERIVGLEPVDDSTELFIQREDGSVYSEWVPNRYWILAPKALDKRFHRLEGNLYYKYGRQFIDRDEFRKYRNIWKSQDVYSIYNPSESLMVKDGYTFFLGMNPSDPSILAFDIETTGIKHDETSKVLLISNTFRKNGKIIRKLFAYDDFKDEGEMIAEWCRWVRECDPSIICGHNIVSFDFPYLRFVCSRYDIELDLGRDGSPLVVNDYESKFRVDGSRDLNYNRLSIYGRSICDTYFLSIKFDSVSKRYETYGLKNIIKQEGLEDKERQFYDASQIRFKYKDKEEWVKIKKYCENDSDDALKLFDLQIPAYFYITQAVPKPFQLIIESASGSQINSLLVRSYLQEGHTLPKTSPTYEFEGAISHGVAGIHRNVISYDVSSLYPSIMLQYEVYDRDKDPKGNFLKILRFFTDYRLKNKALYKETKDKKYDDLQSMSKVFINSGFGFMGSSGLNFNSIANAEFVTRKGREILTNTIKLLTSQDYQTWKQANNV